MKQTNALDFRNQMKTWMDGAKNEPLRITRKNGDAFIMITQEEYEQNQRELAQLRGQYKGLLDAFHGRAEEATPESLSTILEDAKSAAKARMKTKAKKAVG